MTATHYRRDRTGKRVGLDWTQHGGIPNPDDEPTDSQGWPIRSTRRDYRNEDDYRLAGLRGTEASHAQKGPRP